MKKFVLPILALTMVLMLGLFAGCGIRQSPGGGGGAIDAAGQQLHGEWLWEELAMFFDYLYVFYPNGEGWRGVEGIEIETFIWRAEGNHLQIDLTSGPNFDDPQVVTYESWSYSISGDVMTISSRQVDDMVFTLVRFEP